MADDGDLQRILRCVCCFFFVSSAAIGGFVVINDFSARDVQVSEPAGLLCPSGPVPALLDHP